MADYDFLFALDLSDEPHFDRMLQELSRVVLRYVGFDAGIVDAVTHEVRAALASGVAEGRERCGVRFRADRGTLRISIAFAGGGSWEMARALPTG